MEFAVALREHVVWIHLRCISDTILASLLPLSEQLRVFAVNAELTRGFTISRPRIRTAGLSLAKAAMVLSGKCLHAEIKGFEAGV